MQVSRLRHNRDSGWGAPRGQQKAEGAVGVAFSVLGKKNSKTADW